MSNIPTKRLARAAYEGYIKQSGGKSLVTGDPLPPFDQLKPEIQEAWASAAGAIEGEIANHNRYEQARQVAIIAAAMKRALGNLRYRVPSLAIDDAQIVWDALAEEGIL